jgi:hypothetical protein
MPLMLPTQHLRRRNWAWTCNSLVLFVAATTSTQLGCIRFRNDAPTLDAAIADAEVDVEVDMPPEGGDAVVAPPPVCSRFNPNIAQTIIDDLISVLLQDCVLSPHFANLPPIVLQRMQECMTAQIGQVMGCRLPNGEPVRYPTFDSKGRVCRDMKSSHMGLSTSDGDFDAFIDAVGAALDRNGLNGEEKMRVLGVFGNTRNDIVRFKDAGPTLHCDASDADTD